MLSVAEKPLKEENYCRTERGKQASNIPYSRKVGHNLKRSGKKFDISVFLPTPNELRKVYAKVNKCSKQQPQRIKKIMNKFITCQEGVVYVVLHSYGAVYICRTARHVNERFRGDCASQKTTGDLVAPM